MGEWKSLLRLKPFLKKYRLILIAGIAGIILSSILATPIPYLIGHLLDKVLMGNKSYRDLYLYTGAIAALYLLQYGVSLVSKNLFIQINNSVVNEMRYSVMRKVMDLPMSYLSSTEKGYVQSRISECGTVGSIFSPSIVGMFLSIIDALLAIATMFAINYKLAFVVLALTPIFFFSTKVSTKGFMKNTQSMMESSAILNGECFEIINGIEDIKMLSGKEKHLAQFKTKISELVKYSVKQSKSMILFGQNIGLINNAGTLLILFISGILILKGEFTIGLYTSFSLYIAKVFASTQGMALLKGENGSGKTTLIKLLLGLYQPTSGQITVNGMDAAQLNCDSLRQRVGIVSQNIFLFRGTVLNNILYGQSEKTRQDVQKLIEQLDLQEYIGRLANGLDTEISQNTSGVSGGQSQIIAFIRALLSQKDVIILDEPISSVDAETRNLIVRILDKREYDGILIVTSHQTEGMEFLKKVVEIK